MNCRSTKCAVSKSTVKRDWFDDDLVDQSYPDSWDEVGEGEGETQGDDAAGDQVHESAPDPISNEDPMSIEDEVCQLPAEDRIQTKVKARVSGIKTELKTAADMLSGGATPLTKYREGTVVRHADYGEGMIIAVTGRGPKRTAKVAFSDGEHDFRLAFAQLEVVQ